MMIDKEIQNDIGREIVANLGALPGYGGIVWWAGKGSHPLDGATHEWGIDVKTVDHNDPYHRYVPSGKRNYPRVTESKNEQALQMGLKGIIGVLVEVDYRNDTAEIWAKEMPLKAHWFNNSLQSGVYGWNKYDAPRILERVPFKNPMKNPHSHVPLNQ